MEKDDKSMADTLQTHQYHYYGDAVRKLFLAAALIMLIGLPLVNDYLTVRTALSVIGILILGLAAGLTNPKQILDGVLNASISTVGLVIFETEAVAAYHQYGIGNILFLINLVLSFIFLLALYYSMKTLRGMLLTKKG